MASAAERTAARHAVDLALAPMPSPYTIKRLADVTDSAPAFGFSDVQEARFATKALEAERTGFSLLSVKPNQRQPFAHRHGRAEEVYLVLSGSGRVKLDADIVELSPRDAIRVAPEVTRAFEAGPEGMEVLAFGCRHEGDGEVIDGWWSD
jgi:mannose-6-phosphate isomerase-like protein (cupin superfamily)